MATVDDRRSIAVRPTRAPVVPAAPVRPRRKSLDELSDAEAGRAAVGVIVGLAAFIGLILLAIALYAGTRGYALTFTS